MLGLRFQMNSSGVEVGAYPEMWVAVEGFGEAFSKGLNFRLKGSNDWTSCELPFYLRAGQARATSTQVEPGLRGPRRGVVEEHRTLLNTAG